MQEIRKPMLAVAASYQDVSFPCLVSPKLDGIRAMIQNGKVLSRSLKEIPNKLIQATLGKEEFEGLDGELIVGSSKNPKSFSQTTSMVMSIEGREPFKYYIYDYLSNDKYSERLKHLDTFKSNIIVPVPALKVHHIQDLLAYERAFVDTQGFEGIIIRDPESLYKSGRSTLKSRELLKIKRFVDAEATIVGFEKLTRNTGVVEDLLGAFTVDFKGTTFKIGSGFTVEERSAFYKLREALIGKVVKFKYFEHGTKNAPRHPIFVGFRDERDL